MTKTGHGRRQTVDDVDDEPARGNRTDRADHTTGEEQTGGARGRRRLRSVEVPDKGSEGDGGESLDTR